MTRHGRQSGFTFLELILAMALVSILALSLYTSLRAGLRTRDNAIGALSPIRAAEVAMDMIRRDLESALPPTGTIIGQVQSGGIETENSAGFVGLNADDTDAIQFYCSGDDAEFVTASTLDQTRLGGIRKVQFYVTTLPDGTPNVLVRGVTSNLLSLVTQSPEEEVLCRNIKSFNLRYWDASTQSWMDEWDSAQLQNALPTAVEVALEVQWPDRSGEPRLYRTSRIYRLICYFDPTQGSVTVPGDSASTTGGSGSGSGGNK